MVFCLVCVCVCVRARARVCVVFAQNTCKHFSMENVHSETIVWHFITIFFNDNCQPQL